MVNLDPSSRSLQTNTRSPRQRDSASTVRLCIIVSNKPHIPIHKHRTGSAVAAVLVEKGLVGGTKSGRGSWSGNGSSANGSGMVGREVAQQYEQEEPQPQLY
jgi:hypothetical protein